MKFEDIRIVPCNCLGFMGNPCKQVFIEGIDMRSDGRFERPVAEFIAGKLSGKPVPAAVARQFCDLMREQLGEHGIGEVVHLNSKEANPEVCHTHDFCDANLVMNDALEECGVRMDWDSEDGMPDWILALWNEAWKLAKEAGFDAARVTS